MEHTHFDSIALNTDYRYTDPNFYQYRLNVKTEDLDPTIKAIRQDNNNASNKMKGAYKTNIKQRAYKDTFRLTKDSGDDEQVLFKPLRNPK